ncbi:MAG: hypothetical protein ACYTHM_20145 [Planctomycetota bacterium]
MDEGWAGQESAPPFSERAMRFPLHPPEFGATAFIRFRFAESARPPTPPSVGWHAVFEHAFARLGLGLGWAVGLSQVFGVAEGASLTGSLVAFILLLLSVFFSARALPSPGSFWQLGTNVDSPVAWRTMGNWVCTVLFGVNTLFLIFFPGAHRIFLALLGLEMLILSPAAIGLAAVAHRVEPQAPGEPSPLAQLYILSGLASGCIFFVAYTFALNAPYGAAHVHLLFGELLLFGQMVAGIGVLRRLSRNPRVTQARMLGTCERGLRLAVLFLGILIPLLFAFAGFFLDGPWTWIYLPAPLASAGGLFFERVLFHRLRESPA